MANTCRPVVDFCAIRVARLEANGVPDPGANNLYVSDAMGRLTFTPEYEEGAETTVKNGCGALKVNYQRAPTFKRVTINELMFVLPDPQLSELLVGGDVLTSGAAVGYAYPALGSEINPNGVSLECWAKRVDASGDLDSVHPYEWFVLPRVKLRPGARTLQEGPQDSLFSGFAIENENWFNGPLNDWPLTSDSDRVVQSIPTASLPSAVCGYQTITAS
jgi:hypothetical protein